MITSNKELEICKDFLSIFRGNKILLNKLISDNHLFNLSVDDTYNALLNLTSEIQEILEQEL